MSSDRLARYAKTSSGVVAIDVATNRVQDLYNDFDRYAPYSKRDLDADLTDYLLDCAQEIGRHPFMIRINVAETPPVAVQERVRQSLHTFFAYLDTLEQQRMRRVRATSLVLFVIGVAILSAILLLDRWPLFESELVCNLLNQSLTVAAWVSLWESLATYLIDWLPHRRKRALYRRLAKAEVLLQAAGHAPPGDSRYDTAH